MKNTKAKRILAMLLALALTLTAASTLVLAAADTETPFVSIVTDSGKAVTTTYKGMIPAKTEYAEYDEGPYYHVTVPEGTTSVKVTYPEDISILNGGSDAYSYTLSVPDYELGYGSESFAYTENDDGTSTITIPVENYLLTDGKGTATSVEKQNTFDPITFFSFEYEKAQAAEQITVSSSAESAMTLTAGALKEIDLSTIFSDANGHTLTYTFESTVNNEHTKVKDGKFYFSTSDIGTYDVTLTATCSAGATASHKITFTVEQAAEGDPDSYNYNETPADKVTVRVTLSNEGIPLKGNDSDLTTICAQEVTVPYFDLSRYDLENFYRYGTDNGRGQYTGDEVIERPTLLHCYIYLLERYYMGLPEEECGKGTSGVMSYSDDTEVYYMDDEQAYASGSTSALYITGSATSLYMSNFWGHDENLMYYRNHRYPLMSSGWGSTCDYILLSDGDIVDLAMFSNWNFYGYGGFTFFDEDNYTAAAGSTLEFSTQQTATTAGLDGNSYVEVFDGSRLNIALYDEYWNPVNTTVEAVETAAAASDEEEIVSDFKVTLPSTPGTYYLLGTDKGAKSSDACLAPAVAKVTVTGNPFAGLPFSNVYYEEEDGSQVKLEVVTEMDNLVGEDGMSNQYDLPAYKINIPEKYATTGLTVNFVFPEDQGMVEYGLSYDKDNGFGYGAPSMSITENDDGTKTLSIPVSTDFIGTDAYIVPEDDSYKGFIGLTFAVGSISGGGTTTVSVTGVTLDQETLTLERRATATLTATVAPENATNKRITWSSSDETVATVKNGVVTAIAAGETEITVTTKDGELTAKCKVTVTDPDKPDQDTDGTYLIDNAKELAWFAKEVNDGNGKLNAKLTADIDLSTVCSEALGSWTPIGDISNGSSYTFNGVFDGANHTIENLYMNVENSNYASTTHYYDGLFGSCSGATVKNLTVKGSVASTNRYVAAIVGGADKGTKISNCHNYATVTCSARSNEFGYAGIVANLNASTVENCSNHAKISGTCGWTGGIIGETTGDCTIKGCFNGGEVYCFNYGRSFNGVGGILGAQAGASAKVTISDCYNTGKVWQYYETQAKELMIGGIAGTTNAAITIENCYNTGEITCSAKCLETASMSSIVGKPADGTTVTNCYYLSTAKADANATAKTAAEMGAPAFAKALGTAYQTSCPTPVLSWQTAKDHTDENSDDVCDVCGYSNAPQTDENGAYLIGTAEEFAWFAEKINNEGTVAAYRLKDIILTADIDLSNMTWTPIGYRTGVSYGGDFDGKGHTVTLGDMTDGLTHYGLFGYVEGVTIKNLVIEGTVSESGDRVAALAGYATRYKHTLTTDTTPDRNTTIENVINRANVTNTSTDNSTTTAGLAAHATYVSFSKCGNEGKITTDGYVGGLVGQAQYECTLEQCYNTGAIGTDAAGYAGGLIGVFYRKTATNDSFVKNCYNTGSVTASSENGIAGGLAGYIAQSKKEKVFKIENFFTTGTVTGGKAGAIIGKAQYGIYKDVDQIPDEGVYYLSGCADVAVVDVINGTVEGLLDATAMSAEEFALDTFPTSLNELAGSEVFASGEELELGHPVFVWQLDGGDEPEITLGDVNGDGVINATDASLILQVATGATVDGFISAAADVNKDGSVNATDASLILQLATGEITKF